MVAKRATATADGTLELVPPGAVVERMALSRRARLVVVSETLVVRLGALFGGWGLLTDADGLGVKQSWLDRSPFPNYIVPGVVLLIVIGGGMLTTAAAAIRNSRFAPRVALAMGAILLVWGTVETITIGYRGAAQIIMLMLFVLLPAVSLIIIGWSRVMRR